MALTSITPKHRNDVTGNLRVTVTDVVGPSSYTSGGEALTPADLGLREVAWAVCTVKVAGTGSVVAADYDIANEKIKLYAAAAEISGTTDVDAVTVQVVAFGY